MNYCNMGYTINEDGTPPDRCHSEIKYEIQKCIECNNFIKPSDIKQSLSGRYTYKDELIKRLSTIFPTKNKYCIYKIANSIISCKIINPSILDVKRTIVQSWECEYKN